MNNANVKEPSLFVDDITAKELTITLRKVIAKITICGAVTIPVYDYMDWNPPTSEQVKNLKEMLNIDVKLIGEDDEL